MFIELTLTRLLTRLANTLDVLRLYGAWCVQSRFSPISLLPYGMHPARPLCPWDSPGKNIGMGCRALLQGIFQTQGSNSLF